MNLESSNKYLDDFPNEISDVSIECFEQSMVDSTVEKIKDNQLSIFKY